MFCDKGDEYRTAIFATPAQAAAAQAVTRETAMRFPRAVATQVLPARTFYPAEGYHQNYHVKSADQYRRYRLGCGRDRALQAIWGKEAPRFTG